MKKRIVQRLLVLFVVIVSCVYQLASRRIPLGLDLRGGVQVVLRVLTDDVLKAETATTIETLQQEILKNTDQPVKVASKGPGEIQVTGTGPSVP